MSLYLMLRNKVDSKEEFMEEEIEEGFDGNLCRCMGYWFILNVV